MPISLVVVTVTPDDCHPVVVFHSTTMPAAIAVLAMFASAPTSWGHQAAGDVTNKGSLVYLIGFTLVATVAGLVIAGVTAGVSRFARPSQP